MHKHKEFQQKPPTQNPHSGEPLTPLNSLCMGPHVAFLAFRFQALLDFFMRQSMTTEADLHGVIVCSSAALSG